MYLLFFTVIPVKSTVLNKTELSPAYDLLNTTIVLNSKEEIALPIRGKKSKLTRSDFSDFFDYFGSERLGLSEQVLEKEFVRFEKARESWQELLIKSFLSEKMKDRYRELTLARWERPRNA